MSHKSILIFSSLMVILSWDACLAGEAMAPFDDSIDRDVATLQENEIMQIMPAIPGHIENEVTPSDSGNHSLLLNQMAPTEEQLNALDHQILSVSSDSPLMTSMMNDEILSAALASRLGFSPQEPEALNVLKKETFGEKVEKALEKIAPYAESNGVWAPLN